MNKITLTALCVLFVSQAFGYSPEDKIFKADKKIFDDLVNVRYTKLIGGARKTHRIEALNQLSALVVNRVISIIKSAELAAEVKPGLSKLENAIKPVIADAAGNKDIVSANRYAIYEFDKTYDEGIKQFIFPLPSKSQKLHILIKALEKFNETYSKVNAALKQLDPKTTLPREVTLGWIKSFGQ